jgi:small subunit ribosomal protein S11e
MADHQTEKFYQKQHGINSLDSRLLYGSEQPTRTVRVKKNNAWAKKKAKNMRTVRYFKNVGLGFNTPSDAISGHFVDKKCPFTGDVSIRGRIIKGMVISTKMNRTVVIRRDYLHFIRKYQRYEKRHRNIPAHCSPAFKRIKEGDIVTIGQCRPLSKTVRFNVLKVQPNQIFGSVKKQFMLF